MSRNRGAGRLNDTAAIASRSVGGVGEGLYGSERRFRKDRALEAAFAEAIADNRPLPEVIQPLHHRVGDERISTACKELYKK